MAAVQEIMAVGRRTADDPTPPQTLRQRRKAETRTCLLDAARRVISADGYESASVARIAAEAGIAKGALYVHFDSKEALFRELLLEHVQRRSAATAAQIGPDVPLRAGVVRIVEGAWAVYDDGDPCSSLSWEFFAQARRSDWGRDAVASVFDHCTGLLVQFLDHAKTRGEVRADLDTLTAARMMLALHDGLVLQAQHQGMAANPGDWVSSMAEMILRHIEAREETL